MVRSRAWACAAAAGLVIAAGIAGSAVAEDPSAAPNAAAGPTPSSSPAASGAPSPSNNSSDSATPSTSSSASPSDGSASPSDSGTPTVGPGDAAFLGALHQGDLAEVSWGRDAAPHAAAACVMRVGAALVRDRGAMDKAVSELSGQLKIGLPPSPTPAQNDQLARIGKSAGTSGYDTQWLRARSAAHAETLRLIDQEIVSSGQGDHAKVVAAAQSARPVVAHHLAMEHNCHPLGASGAPQQTASGVWKSPHGRWSATHVSVLVVGSLLVIAASAWATRRWHRDLSR
ncbi:DUF4142 domain-containing protein [Streptantibioticus rubrisoli]|uniref:DUF4142 domain-containing protein n=1 Tax=Streptantibioticus rubrisoli TaxID=1387313 RepID=A0ABT1P702_9ACTN|nr:DUF4142 domain-containing protein [Streptantibioticus rubrisoli]MCQ4041154.1 DUF4142 domain-containing protein [Streptantibioticus rubrisoli]